jgi:very-short-patch-repair endonuclease
MAAVLACGEGAVLSHRPAAALLRLLPATPGPIDITIPHSRRAGERDGIRVHRSRTLTSDLVTRRNGIPVTTPARTIGDLRRVLSPGLLRRAIREAEAIGLDIGEEVEAERTESELEHRFLRLCRRHRLPMPEVNAELGGFRVDFLWRGRAMVVETDGYRYHRGRQAFEDDRARDTRLRLMGYEVVRFTYRQLTDDPKQVATTLRALLANSRPAGGQAL